MSNIEEWDTALLENMAPGRYDTAIRPIKGDLLYESVVEAMHDLLNKGEREKAYGLYQSLERGRELINVVRELDGFPPIDMPQEAQWPVPAYESMLLTAGYDAEIPHEVK